jgi:hypothetical protein
VQLFSIICFSIAMALLVGIAAYAIFGKPSSRKDRKDKRELANDLEHVKNGFVKAGGWLLLLITAPLLMLGAALTIFPNQTDQGDSVIPLPPRVTGILFLALGSVIVYSTQRRWVRYLPSFLSYGSLGAFIALVLGRYGNQTIPRWQSFTAIVMLNLGALFASSYRNRSLDVTDRLLLFLIIVAPSTAYGLDGRFAAGHPISSGISFVGIAISFFCLFLGWLRHRVA